MWLKKKVDDVLEVDYHKVATSNNGSEILLIILLHAITLLLQAFCCAAVEKAQKKLSHCFSFLKNCQ